MKGLPAILVTDGEQRSALAVVRSLGSAGYPVYVTSARSRSLAGASRYCSDEIRTADPLALPSDFVADIKRVIAKHDIRILLPVTEPSLLALLPQRDHLGAMMPIGSEEIFKRICDKALVLETACDIGIGVPEQYVLTDAASLQSVPMNELKFPIIVKPSRSVSLGASGRTKTVVRTAADLHSLRAIVTAIPESAFPVLLQRRIVGPGEGAFLLLWDGEVRASFCHRRLREKPPSGGVSVYRESIPPDATLLKRSEALLRRLGWQGVAMVEYKIEDKTGTPFLMEINGRFWGSLQLAIDAGVDFPVLLVEAALGKARAPVPEYDAFLRSRWGWGDVDHLIARMRHSADALGLPPGAPGRMRSLLDFIVSFRTRDEVARLDDPRPAWREFVTWLRRG